MTPAFTGARFDRAARLRGTATALAERSDARVLLLSGETVALEGDRLCWRAPGDPLLPPPADWAFLGLLDGAPRFAAQIAAQSAEHSGGFGELRPLLATLTPDDGGLVATAKALLGWHATHRFCARCGAPSEPREGFWQRACPTCGGLHFPRTDPVVIMTVSHGNSLLLGRSPGWPEGMFSCLAGFIEPGETPEEAVRREVDEETGIRIGAVRYAGAQPWPFPASLMLGFHAEAETTEITLDPAELEAACWVGREELAEVFRGTHPAIRAPRKGAIAGWLLMQWLEGRAS